MFEYFRDNYTWNLATIMAINTGGNITEIDDACRGLKHAATVNDAASAEIFFQAWIALGDRVSALAEADEKSGNMLAAGNKYLRASIYYMTGERMAAPYAPRKLHAYKKMLRCFALGIQYRRRGVERVEIPYGDTALPALYIRGEGTGPRPCMVHFDGLDVTKELIYLSGIADEFRLRGVSTLIVDHPGVGEALRLRGLKGMAETEKPASACVDYLETIDEVDSGRLGMIALSLGGYYAPRAAAFEKRFRCCVAWGGVWDLAALRRSRMEGGGAESSVVHMTEHLNYVFGTGTIEEMQQKTSAFTLEDIISEITCPLLVVHGENDRQVPFWAAEKTYEGAVKSPRRQLRGLSLAEGGAQHCSVDNFMMSHDIVAQWVAEILNEAA